MKANARLYSLFVCLVVFIPIQASHFQGGTITYRILNVSGSTVSILLTQTYSYTRQVIHCNDTTIANGSLLIYGVSNELGYLKCINHCNQSGGYANIPITLKCIDYSTSLDITVGQRSDVISLTNGSYFLVSFDSNAWRPLFSSSGGSWSISCLINLRMRSNGRFNNPPVAMVNSPIYIPEGIQRAILILTIDADNDQVRCRVATGWTECGDVCYPSSLPNGTIILPNCTLFIKGAMVSHWYAVTIMVEDFVDSTSTIPLSSIPVQFLINVQANDSCASPPLLTSPTVHSGQCVGVQVGQLYSIQFVAENFCPNSTTILDITTFSFKNVNKSPIVQNTTTLWSVLLTWIPTIEQIGSQGLCAMGVDSAHVQSNQYCLTFIVAEGSVPLCPGQTAPATFSQESSTSSQEITSIYSIVVPPPSVCNFPWPWPWLAPVLSALATLLLVVCIYCCCCNTSHEPRSSREDHEKRFSTNSTSHQDPDQNNRPPRPKNKVTPAYIKPQRQTSRVAPTSTSASARPSTSTIQEAHRFSGRVVF